MLDKGLGVFLQTLDSILPGETYFISVTGTPSLPGAIGIKWLTEFVHNDTCINSDTIKNAITYGSNLNSNQIEQFEIGLTGSSGSICETGVYPTMAAHGSIYNPVFYTLLPTQDSFTIHVNPISCFDRTNTGIIRIFIYKDCTHIGDYSKDTLGNFLYFYGCSEDGNITIHNVSIGQPLILRVDPNRLISGDFDGRRGNICNFSIQGTGFLLPLTLTNFIARYSNVYNIVSLAWAMQTEANNSKFIIERSDDGSHFYAIGEKKSKYQPGETNYKFEDKGKMSGIIYYRLKLLSADGKYSYSKIEIVNITGKSLITVYPNPAHDLVNVVFNSKTTDNATVSLINSVGKVQLMKLFNINTRNNHFEINTSSLPKGVYFMKVKIANSDDEWMERIVIY